MLGLALRPVPLMVNRNDLQPALLILEIVLHSIDVPHPGAQSREELVPCAYALQGVMLVGKPKMVKEVTRLMKPRAMSWPWMVGHRDMKKAPRHFCAKCLIFLVGRAGFEPATNGLKVRCSTN